MIWVMYSRRGEGEAKAEGELIAYPTRKKKKVARPGYDQGLARVGDRGETP